MKVLLAYLDEIQCVSGRNQPTQTCQSFSACTVHVSLIMNSLYRILEYYKVASAPKMSALLSTFDMFPCFFKYIL